MSEQQQSPQVGQETGKSRGEQTGRTGGRECAGAARWRRVRQAGSSSRPAADGPGAQVGPDLQRVLSAPARLVPGRRPLYAVHDPGARQRLRGADRTAGAGRDPLRRRAHQPDGEEGRASLRGIDPARYQLAVAAAEAQLALTQQNLRVSSSTVDAAAACAGSREGRPGQGHAERGSPEAHRCGCPRRDFAARRWSGRRPPASRARPRWPAPRPICQKAIEALGPRDEKNPQLLAARAALDKAKLDLQYTRIVAPNDGLVTDLRVDVGNFAATGQPLMTFVAVHRRSGSRRT